MTQQHQPCPICGGRGEHVGVCREVVKSRPSFAAIYADAYRRAGLPLSALGVPGIRAKESPQPPQQETNHE